jgi:hypothetical protein
MTKTHKLERRISALETRIGLASDPVTEIWLVSPKEGKAGGMTYFRITKLWKQTGNEHAADVSVIVRYQSAPTGLEAISKFTLRHWERLNERQQVRKKRLSVRDLVHAEPHRFYGDRLA